MNEQREFDEGDRVYLPAPHDQYGKVVQVLRDSDGVQGYMVQIDAQDHPSGPYREVVAT